MTNSILIIGPYYKVGHYLKGECLRFCKGLCGKSLRNDVVANPYYALEYKDTGYCVDCFRITEIIENLKRSMETYERLKEYSPPLKYKEDQKKYPVPLKSRRKIRKNKKPSRRK